MKEQTIPLKLKLLRPASGLPILKLIFVLPSNHYISLHRKFKLEINNHGDIPKECRRSQCKNGTRSSSKLLVVLLVLVDNMCSQILRRVRNSKAHTQSTQCLLRRGDQCGLNQMVVEQTKGNRASLQVREKTNQ